MKALSLSNLLAIGLALAVGEVRAGMWQSPGGNSPQQFNGQGREMVRPASSGLTQPTYTGQGRVLSMQPTTAAQFAQPGHSIIRAQPPPVRNTGSGRMNTRGSFAFGHRSGFDHDHFRHHRSSIVVFVNSVPFWYPVYTAYPYYYDAPPPVTYNSASYTSDEGYVPPVDNSAADYSGLGASWGQDLRREVVTWDQFVAYLKAYVVTATPDSQADFREAFINAYHLNGGAAYDKASLEAAGDSSQPQGPKVITMPPTEY
jgi:hypothetical protein